MKSSSLRHKCIFLLAGALLVTLASSAGAQLITYPAKFVCGYQPGNLPFLNDGNVQPGPDSYEMVKPGNYATVVNILNLNTTVQPVTPFIILTDLADAPGLPAPQVALPVLNLAFATAVRFDCQDIANAILAAGGTVNGNVIEGYLTLSTSNARFTVDAVYTYLSQNGFKELHWLASNSGFIGAFGSTYFHPIIALTSALVFSQSVNLNMGAPKEALGGAGAGGLGLGASIDVETIAPVNMSP